ncbi:hypothetical protein [Thalassotalea ganghwensis]
MTSFVTELYAETISVSHCKYITTKEDILSLNVAIKEKIDAILYCPTSEQQKLTLHNVALAVSAPSKTPLGNCQITKYALGKDDTTDKYLWSSAIGNACPRINENEYVSLHYLPSEYNKDLFFDNLTNFLSRLNANELDVITRIPFYSLWFCSDCKEFINAVPNSKFVVNRIGSSINDPFSIFVSSKEAPHIRWILHLSVESTGLFIKNVVKYIGD